MSTALVLVPTMDHPIDEHLSLDRLAERIEYEHREAEARQGEALRHACIAGAGLIIAKARVGHGGFGPWINEHCSFGWATANLYMRIARKWDQLPNSERATNMSLRRAAKLIRDLDREEPEPELVPPRLTPDPVEVMERIGLPIEELAALSARQAEAVVAEVEHVYWGYCDAAYAEAGRAEADGPPITVNTVTIRTLTLEAIRGMEEGKIGYTAARKIIRCYGFLGRVQVEFRPWDGIIDRCSRSQPQSLLDILARHLSQQSDSDAGTD